MPAPPVLPWSDTDRAGSLQRMAWATDQFITNQIIWYRRKKPAKRWVSVGLRVISLGFLILGGLAPFVPPSLQAYFDGTDSVLLLAFGSEPAKVGYLLLALGGGLYMFDKMFGMSSGWMRFMFAELELTARRNQFRMDWQMWCAKHGVSYTLPDIAFSNPIKKVPLWRRLSGIGFDSSNSFMGLDEPDYSISGSEPALEMAAVFAGMKLADDLIESVDGVVLTETQQWVNEFQSALAQMDDLSRRRGATEPKAPSGKNRKKPR
jgi:hypothetical protein